MRILLAFDKFKGTLTAAEVHAVVADVLASRLPAAHLRSTALADGGDGTLAVALGSGYEPVEIDAADALGRPTTVKAGLSGRRGFIEMAATCGLAAIAPDERDGLRSTSLGLGLAATALLDLGVDDITIGLGGSASTDGGLGFLVGLGAEAADAAGSACSPDALGLGRVSRLRLGDLHPGVAECRWTFLTDVDSPLLGEQGAARMFGPQKGLGPADVDAAEAALARWAELVRGVSGRNLAGRPGAGAAGGIVVGAAAITEPRIISGADYVADVTGLDSNLDWADLVITGEGCLDEQSVLGKVPGMVLERAAAAGTSVGVIAGRIDLVPLPVTVSVSVSLEEVAGSPEAARLQAREWLARATDRFVESCRSTGLLTGIEFE